MVWVGLDWGCLYMVFLFCFEGFGGLLWNCLFGLVGLLFWIAVWVGLVGGLRFCWVCARCCESMFISFVI